MRPWKSFAAGGLAAFAATHVSAQAVAPPDPPFALVPAEDRLTLLGVFMDADIVVKLIMAGLLVAAVAALAVWIAQAARARSAGTVRGLGFLSALGAGGPLIGFFGSAYTLLHSFIGLSNVRPAPTLSVLAPGFAEATLCAALGLLAAAIATIGHRHIQSKLLRRAASSEPETDSQGLPMARLARQPA